MSERDRNPDPQRDKNLAADERPMPSQAEGDRETIDQDLADQTARGKEEKPDTKR